MNPLEIRNKINSYCMNIDGQRLEVRSVVDRDITTNSVTLPLRIYTPCENQNSPLILMIHGGGWVAGNLETHDNLARFLCHKVSAVVVSVGYSNAPEAKYPIALEQCYGTLQWIIDNKKALDFSGKISIVGDSAGGNLAAALCLLNKQRANHLIDSLVLINPALDLRCGGTLVAQGDRQDFLRWQATQYINNPSEVNLPLVSPLLADDLAHFPNTLITIAELDALRSDGEQFAEKLSRASVPTELFCQLGIDHLGGDGARASVKAQESLDWVVNTLATLIRC